MKRPVSVNKNRLVEVHQVAARRDNYIYIVRDPVQNLTIVMDPSVPGPALAYCQDRGWKATHVLITHHHYDHVEGIDELKSQFGCPVLALADDSFRVPGCTDTFKKDASLKLGTHGVQTLFTPGHTLGHVSYYFSDLGFLFCGDTLFSFGCGRLFEGTPEMMMASLARLRVLPSETTFFCGHEYTVNNLEFALSLEPESQTLRDFLQKAQALRAQGQSTVPASLGQEIRHNPFLRWDDPQLRQALGMETATDLEVFTLVRSRRNSW